MIQETISLKLRDQTVARVNALRVGRFAVRGALPEETHIIFPRYLRPWAVVHVNTGTLVGDFSSHGDALAFADDLSRFSAKDPASRDPRRVIKQMGPAVVEWARAIHDSGAYVPFPRPQRD